MVTAAEILNARILIVDDQEANVRLLEEILSSEGYSHVESTVDSHAVCAMHGDNRYDLILLDLQMPGMDGFEVLAGLNAIETGGYVPVLVVTAQPGHKLKALASGAKDFIAKPFDLVEVKTRIHNLLEVRLLYKKLGDYNKVLAQTVAERTSELLGTNEQLSLEVLERKEAERSLRSALTEIEQLRDRISIGNSTSVRSSETARRSSRCSSRSSRWLPRIRRFSSWARRAPARARWRAPFTSEALGGQKRW
jgi:CheY-like chemotaxis protein